VKTTNADSLRLGGRYDYNLTDRVFAFGAAEAETNQAGLRYRFSADVGAGYHVIRTPDTNFDVYGGVGVARNQYRSQWSSAYSLNGQPAVYQFQGDASASGAELLFGEESMHRLTSTTSFKQRLKIRPGSGDLGTLATFDAGLATAITGAWTLNTGVTVRHASKVPFGRKTTDSLLTVGFGYKY
jgi:putative salt-induced outer membrane protein